jgi:hypothetical protein
MGCDHVMVITKSHKYPYLKQYWIEVLIVSFGVVIINLIFVPKAFRQTDTVNSESAAQLGAFVGGYIGSVFALISVVLLFSTLRSQRRAAEDQSFETKYFELLRIQRDNISEIRVRNATGRKMFVLMLRELRCALSAVQTLSLQMGLRLSQKQALHIAYYVLFFGVGPNSSRMLKVSLAGFDGAFIDALDRCLGDPQYKRRVRSEAKLGYAHFDGHQSRLGHYYRHLYQMVRYVDLQKSNVYKYEYLKTIRAQLSTHEQALLLINSLTPIGENWWKKRLIVTYRLVQNIPHDFFDSSTELDLRNVFEPGYFEWEDVGRVT